MGVAMPTPMRLKSRLIVALDVTEESRDLRLAADVRDYVDAFKVNYPLVLSRGMQVVEKLAKIGDVICDFKVADIPNTNRLIVDQVFRFHAKAVIIHWFVGEDSVRSCIDAARGGVFVVAGSGGGSSAGSAATASSCPPASARRAARPRTRSPPARTTSSSAARSTTRRTRGPRPRRSRRRSRERRQRLRLAELPEPHVRADEVLHRAAVRREEG